MKRARFHADNNARRSGRRAALANVFTTSRSTLSFKKKKKKKMKVERAHARTGTSPRIQSDLFLVFLSSSDTP